MKKTKPEQDSSLRDTYLTLTKFQRNHNLAYIKFKGDDTVYQSMILTVDPVDKSIMIDELFPKDNGFLGLEGSTISLLIRDKGFSIAFESKIISRLEKPEGMLYKIKMPDFLDKQQRRNAFRIKVESGMSVAAVVANDEHQLSAKVINISASGLQIALEGRHKNIEEGTCIENIILRYGDDQTMSCDLDVRHTQYADEPNEQTYIGGRFIDMIDDEHKQLEKYILKLQRQVRRRDSAAA